MSNCLPINSRYFTIPEITSLEVDSSDLSILHTNIRSLSLHHKDLITLCALTKVNYDIIGVSETWNQTHKETLNNASIDGYDHYDTCNESSIALRYMIYKIKIDVFPRWKYVSSKLQL